MSKEVNPRAVFDRLFGPAELPAEDRARRGEQQRRKSILDFAAEDATDLRRNSTAATAASSTSTCTPCVRSNAACRKPKPR